MNPSSTFMANIFESKDLSHFLILALLALPLVSRADEDSTGLFNFYGKLYPEWKIEKFTHPSTAGTVVGTMGTLKNNTVTLSSDASDKPDTEDHVWSNSYLGVKGEIGIGAIRAGYDVQGIIDLQGDSDNLWKNARDNLETRDAYVFMETPTLGQLAGGKMDSIYKEWGDQVSMLGVSSGNFVSTSRILSKAGWKGKGDSSFHNRRSHSMRWISPSFNGVEIGLTHSYDEQSDGSGGSDTKLSAAAIRWQEGPWYVALATEIHDDWLPLSRGVTSSSASSILNIAESTSSKDQAWRLSMAWSNAQWRIGADVARLHYSERDTLNVAGKFRTYQNISWQIGAEYKWNSNLRLAATHTRASAGQCTLSGDVSCTTTGQSGHHTSLGILYSFGKSLGLFALASHTHNGDATYYGSAPQGANANIHALGIKYEFK